MNSCMGCGVLLQNEDKNALGFSSNIDSCLCERCFRIKNYGDYKTVIKSNTDFINILKSINDSKDLVVLVVDVFNNCFDFDLINKYISNDILLVLTKRDIIPRSVSDIKLLNYFDRYNINYCDKIIVSSNKNYNFDKLFESINKYKKSNNVYVVGFTNAGKSTLINKLIYNYSDYDSFVTTSILPSTTLNTINIKLNDNLNIIDTPGLLYSGSFYDILPGNELKNVIPKKEIKPISYQIKGKQYICISKYAVVEANDINLVFFMSNSLDVKRFYKPIKTSLAQHNIDVNNQDIVIDGLGFIKVIGCGIVNIYTYENINVYTRDYLV